MMVELSGVANGQPFFSSGAGAVMLLMLGALFSGAVAWFLNYRRDVKKQNDVLLTLRNAIVPEGRAGLVERVERVESNVSVCAAELEQHMTLTATQRAELLASLAELRRWCEEALRVRGDAA